MTPRDRIVEQLAPLMTHELARNAWKGDQWHLLAGTELGFEVLYHAAKLQLAIVKGDREAMAELFADVANCAAIGADALDVADVELLPAADEPSDYDPARCDGGMRYGSDALKALVRNWLGALDAHQAEQDAVVV